MRGREGWALSLWLVGRGRGIFFRGGGGVDGGSFYLWCLLFVFFFSFFLWLGEVQGVFDTEVWLG